MITIPTTIPDKYPTLGHLANQAPAYFLNKKSSFGVTIIAAKPRVGKSCQAKTLITQISGEQGRNLIIFDYCGEYQGLTIPNPKAKHKCIALTDLEIIDIPKFKIQEFTNEADWLSIGFPELAATECAEIAKQKKQHKNNPDIVNKMIEQLKSVLYPSTYISLKRRWRKAKNFFWHPQDQIKEEYIPHWGKHFLNHPKLCINLNLTRSEADKKIGQFFTGKILEQLMQAPNPNKPNLNYIALTKPLIVIEEADILCPWVSGGRDLDPNSLEWLRMYVLKFQKFSVHLMFITQDLSRLDPEITAAAHHKIIGCLDDTRHCPYPNIIKNLKWLPELNIRQFAYLPPGNRPPIVYTPMDCPCAY